MGPQNKLFSRSDLMSPVPRTSESDLTATPDRSEDSLPSSESRAGHVTSNDTLNHVEYPSNGQVDHVKSHDNGLNRHVQTISNGSASSSMARATLASPPPVHRTMPSASDPLLTGFSELQQDSRRDSIKSFS